MKKELRNEIVSIIDEVNTANWEEKKEGLSIIGVALSSIIGLITLIYLLMKVIFLLVRNF
ncbi:MAG: hypothetical protein AABY22_12225 [Nanoarchaeota archaeon]